MYLHDRPWRRLPWLVPISFIVALLSLMGFLRLLMEGPQRSSLLKKPIEVGIFELSAPAAIVSPETAAQPAPPEPAIVASPAEELPPPPLPEPSADAVPSPPRPQKRPPPPRPRRQQEPSAAAAPPSGATVAPQATPTAPDAAAPSRPGGGSTGARAILQPMPEIPDELRRRRIDAVAIVIFNVAADGSATVELREATDDPRLNQVLLAGFRRWRFFPALDHDRPVASIIELRVPIEVR